MRVINDHKVNPANDRLEIEVMDEPGAGGAHHHYFVHGFHTINNPSAPTRLRDETAIDIIFQNGPIAEVGVNGLTQEALIAICIDRLRSFQAGPFACPENAAALKSLEEAQEHLHNRTRGRMARGVEGTHAV
jgi:hypothetical protein